MPYQFCIALCVIVTIAAGTQSQQSDSPPPPSAVERLKSEAEALKPLADTSVAQQFLDATQHLPSIGPRTIYRDPTSNRWLNEHAAQALTEEQRAALKPMPVAEAFYYYTGYGSPLAYFRVLDIAGANGISSLNNKKILDFGYGTIGHLRNMAACGAHAVGMDVDSRLTAMYSDPSDTGDIITGETRGSIQLVSGRFADPAIVNAVGENYDLITSKNTLKRGYIHPPPEENVDKRFLVDLGVSDEAFLQHIHKALKPGGVFIIYNLSLKLKPDQKYNPASDGRCPFDREVIEKAGFEILRFDASDNDRAHAMAKALGWNQGAQPMDVENDLVSLYTVLRKPIK